LPPFFLLEASREAAWKFGNQFLVAFIVLCNFDPDSESFITKRNADLVEAEAVFLVDIHG